MNIYGRPLRVEARDFLDDTRIPGNLQMAGSSLTSPAYALDVSAHGLGLILASPVEAGAEMDLVIGDRLIKLAVRHCRRDDVYGDVFHCGLAVQSGVEDLRSCFDLTASYRM